MPACTFSFDLTLFDMKTQRKVQKKAFFIEKYKTASNLLAVRPF